MVFEWYWNAMSNGDERLAHLPLMSGPLPVMLICGSYVLFVKYLGPRLMSTRRPFEIRYLMICYNFIMVLISVALVYVFAVYAWFNGYSYKCQPVDYSPTGDGLLIARASYAYFVVKFLEFFDTIFFVLRKKYSHISTLHVIHHGLMPFSVWWGLKFVPGGHATFFGFVNSIVHVIMYTYYGLAAIGPQMSKYLWWKRYLTLIQMVQFVLIFVHSFQLIFRFDCRFPRIFGVWISMHGVLFWFLFSHFYRKTYLTNKSKTATTSASKLAINANGHQSSSSTPKSLFDVCLSPQLNDNCSTTASTSTTTTSNKYNENNNKLLNGLCNNKSNKLD